MKYAWIAALALAACVADVGTDKVAAKVEDRPTVEAPATAAVGETWQVDRAQSKLSALGAKITQKHPIAFPDFSGTVTVGASGVTGVSFVAQTGSLQAEPEHLQDHLKNEDFLDVTRYPTATFTSTEVKPGSDVAGMTHTVTGDLTIRGKTLRLSFPAKIDQAADRITADTEFVVDRQDFGISYPGKADDLVQDNVVLTIHFVAVKPVAPS